MEKKTTRVTPETYEARLNAAMSDKARADKESNGLRKELLEAIFDLADEEPLRFGETCIAELREENEEEEPRGAHEHCETFIYVNALWWDLGGNVMVLDEDWEYLDEGEDYDDYGYNVACLSNYDLLKVYKFALKAAEKVEEEDVC